MILKNLLITSIILITSCADVKTPKPIADAKPNLRTEEALAYSRQNNMNTDFCILIDMETHSGKERFVVWDFNQNKILKQAQVSHGCGKQPWGGDYTKEAPLFSNQIGSHLSSEGKYAIAERAWSNWGINIKYWLDGLESTNYNARVRTIVLHGWDSVSDEEKYPSGTSEGWGCPAVSDNMMTYLDSKLRHVDKPVLFWIYDEGTL